MTTLLKIMEINVNKGSLKDHSEVSTLETMEEPKQAKVAKLIGTTLAISAAATGAFVLSRIAISIFKSLFRSSKRDMASE
jgi:hypothetical protein